jgi:ribosomal protein S18 acetylase RimI-like enzyme
MLMLRPAYPADAEAIARIYVEAWRSAYPGLVPDRVLVRMSARAQARQWSMALARHGRNDRVVIAETADAGVVGFGSCGEARPTGLPPAGEIFTLYVAPEHQGQGIGRAVLYRLFDTLADHGLNSALVWVLAGNPSRFFYEAMGGRRIAERVERLWDQPMPQAAYGWDDVRSVPRRGAAFLE